MQGEYLESSGSSTTGYWEYYYLKPNRYGLVNVSHDMLKNEWWLVHASTYRFPMKYENGIASGMIYLGA